MKLIRVISSLLSVVSMISINPMGVRAEWKQDSNGWWNTEENSWSIGWKEIDGKWYYFDNNGYMKTGWIQYQNKWYYLNTDGTMAKNTNIDGYSLGSDGTWSQNNKNTYEELDKLPTNYSIDLAKKNGDVVMDSVGEYYNIEKLDNFVKNYQNNKLNVGDMVRITSYSTEGGSVICDLTVGSDGFKLINDNTRDGYSDQTKKEYKVVNLYKKCDKNNVTSYYVKTDQGEEICIL